MKITYLEHYGECTKKDIIVAKNFMNFEKINDIADCGVGLHPKCAVKLRVEKESGDNFDVIVLLSDNGNYYTGSNSFMNRFEQIWDDYSDALADGIDDIFIAVVSLTSKSTGHKFLSCYLY